MFGKNGKVLYKGMLYSDMILLGWCDNYNIFPEWADAVIVFWGGESISKCQSVWQIHQVSRKRVWYQNLSTSSLLPLACLSYL